MTPFLTSMFSRCMPFFRKRTIGNEEISQPCQPNLQIMPVVMMEGVQENQDIQSIDPCQPNLPNMPTVVLEEVLNNLDYRSIFRLRKVCRGLRFSIDRIEPKLHVKSLSFQLPLTTESLKSYMKGMSRSVKKFNMRHHEPRAGCKIEWELGSTSEITMEEAETFLKNTKLTLDKLNIDFLFEIVFAGKPIKKKEEDLKKFYESLKSSLKNKDRLLETKEIRMQVHNLSEAAGLLKCIDPKSLGYISIHVSGAREAIEMNFSELEALEQWKNTNVLGIRGNYILTLIESFSSFKAILLRVNVIPIEKLNEMKEFFIRSPKLQILLIESFKIREMEDLILSNFGQFDSYNEEFLSLGGESRMKRSSWTWLQDVPGTTEKLQITLKVGWENHITFQKFN